MVRLGEILLDANVLTKRQLSQALAMQEAGDKRKLGEILVELEYITVEDLADIMMVNGHPQEDRLPVVEELIAPILVVPKQPIDISENVVMKTKFALDIKTMITAAVGIATLVGFWYALQADIQEAKELPKIGNIYSQEYPSRPEGYNWPRSYEQYKSQVGQLQTDMDDVLDLLDEYEEKIDDLEKEVTNLRIQLANKKDK
jgi:hypothetical protein